MRNPECEEVARLVQDPRVLSGRLRSPYDIFDWYPISAIPWKFQPAKQMIDLVLHPLQTWEYEAYRIEYDLPEYTVLNISLRSRIGRSPLHVKLFDRPTLRLRDIVLPVFSSLAEKLPIKLNYRYFRKVEFPFIFALFPEGDNSDNVPRGEVPGYDKMVIKPFWLFPAEEDEKTKAEDPYRVTLQIEGAPIRFIIRELRRQGLPDETIASVLLTDPNAFLPSLKAWQDALIRQNCAKIKMALG